MKTNLRPKTCRMCPETFQPATSLQVVCSPGCGLAKAKADREAKERKAKRKETREWREASRPKAYFLKRAQAAFNEFVRARDHGKPCISCNRLIPAVKYGGSVDAGHYRSTGAASHLRFNLWNCHSQCKQCNRDYSGNVVDYRISLIRRIGQDRVEALEADNDPRAFKVEYLKRLAKLFRRRARHYRKLRGIE